MLAEVGHAVEILAGRVLGREGRGGLVPAEMAVEGFVCFGEANHV